MNTIKSREHIREAYFNHKIKNFALDNKDELLKIIDIISARTNPLINNSRTTKLSDQLSLIW